MPLASYSGHINERNTLDRYDRNDYDYIKKSPPLKISYSPSKKQIETPKKDKYLQKISHKEFDISNKKKLNNANHKQLNNTIKNNDINKVAINMQVKHKKRKVTKKQLAALSKMKAGQVCRGRVKNITEYGAFINLGFIDGLMHKSKMPILKDGNPHDIISVGDKIEIAILSIDYKTGRISLAMKKNLTRNISKKK